MVPLNQRCATARPVLAAYAQETAEESHPSDIAADLGPAAFPACTKLLAGGHLCIGACQNQSTALPVGLGLAHLLRGLAANLEAAPRPLDAAFLQASEEKKLQLLYSGDKAGCENHPGP